MEALSEEFDVVIVGSGPTGATYARVIHDARPDVKILMVEAGPIIADPPGQHVANIADLKERERAQVASQGPNQFPYVLPATSGIASNVAGGDRGRALITRPGMFSVGSGEICGDGFPAAQASCNVGGMGSHWFGACPRPSKQESIGFIDAGEMEKALARAEKLLRVKNEQFRASRFAAHVERVVGGALNSGRTPDRYVQPMPMAVTLTPSGVTRSGPNVIFDYTASEGRNFVLRPETLCERVILDGNRAAGVRLRNRRTGTAKDVRANCVVIAGDSLRTPQLLFASGIRPHALGHFLNEHPQVSVMAEIDGLGEDEVHGNEPGDATAMSDSKAVAIASSGVTWIPYNGEDFLFSAMLVQVNPDTIPQTEAARLARKPLISIHLFGIQELRYENRLEFSETECDWIGMPAMKIHFSLSQRDKRTLEHGKELVLRLARVLGRPVEGETPWILPPGSSLHYQGTIRMGEKNDGRSVCDSKCRVWDLENLYVAGNGVIPTETACNPTLTSVALATMGAEDILVRLSS